ncbi:GNAT family N-acetyltransferase [Altericroceibacterium spongiae]|nr:GNAT family N-acetyltransferase [Altericroceibacterium spongiae]
MNDRGVDPQILKAWLSARSIARGLSAPVPEYGGFRVDTRSDTEVARWVFPQIVSGLETLAHSICKPRYFLKLCGSAEDLRALLPANWTLHAPSYFMQATSSSWPVRHLPRGYRIALSRANAVSEVRIFSEAGDLAASGYGAEAGNVFIYDRIVTQPDHRRRGLGRILMQKLHETKSQTCNTQLLVATEDGRSLYATLGWKTISPYSTASIVSA